MARRRDQGTETHPHEAGVVVHAAADAGCAERAVDACGDRLRAAPTSAALAATTATAPPLPVLPPPPLGPPTSNLGKIKPYMLLGIISDQNYLFCKIIE